MKLMKNIILALSIFGALNGMELKKNETSNDFSLEKSDDVALYPDLNRRIDRSGKVIGTFNGHIYWQPDSSVNKKSITLSPNGKLLAYCSNDGGGKNMKFSFFDLESEKEKASLKPTEQPAVDSHPSAFFVDNDIVYLSSGSGYPLYRGDESIPNDFPVYAFYDIGTKEFSKIKNSEILRGFAAINAKSVLLAATEKPPHQIYALDPKNKTLKKTGMTTRTTPQAQVTNDGSMIAIGDLKYVKTYNEKNGLYTRVGIWKFLENHITAFAFDKNNRLTIATENGDICVCDPELKATLILMNINTIANQTIKDNDTFSGIVTKMRPLSNTIIATIVDTKTRERDLYLINGNINRKLEELKKACKKERDKRKNACVTL